MAEIRRGSKQAFKQLFDDYYPVLCAFAYHYIKSGEVCEDIVQETFLAYWERREDFDDILKVKSFLYAVVRNKSLNYLKHDEIDISDYADELDGLDTDSETAIIEQETYRMVRKAVDGLPSQMRNIIVLSINGLTRHEIAEQLQISEGTVHALKKIAYRKLRETLKGMSCAFLLFFCK